MWNLIGSYPQQHEGQVAWMCQLRDCLRSAVRATIWVLAVVCKEGQVPDLRQRAVLRLGLAKPGITGCSDIAGTQVRWDPLLHHNWGLQTAIGPLAFDAIGLTAPRLPSAVPSPRSLGMHIFSKGEQSYASAAVLRSINFQFISAVRSDIGSNRRLWVDVQLEGNATLHWVILTMPTSAGDRDDEWVEELKGLAEDLTAFCTDSHHRDMPLIFGTGDMNFQPDELGGGREPCRKRQTAWELCRSFGLVLHNPPLADQEIVSVPLPFRERHIRTREASTRHGIGVGRAIDLVFSSANLLADVTIHNGVHCAETCPLQLCQEICRGDHFLLQVDVRVRAGLSSGPAAPAFPGKWHDTNKWNLALRPAETLLQCLGQLILEAGDELCLQQEQAGNKHPGGIEAATALANTIAGFARDIWMGSAPSPPLHSHEGPNLQAAVLLDLPEETRDLVQQLLRHTSNSAMLNSCFKLLRDPAPQPFLGCPLVIASCLNMSLTRNGCLRCALNAPGRPLSMKGCTR